MAKKILFFAYPMYADFEIAHTLFFLRKVGNATITTATVDGDPVESVAGLITKAHAVISDVDPRDYDMVLVSGGDGIAKVVDDNRIREFLISARMAGIPIASICASAVLLGKAGLLAGKQFTCTPNTYEMFKAVFDAATYTGTRLEITDKMITAKGTAFPEFTLAVLDTLALWKNEEQRDYALRFCKGEV
ncbi:DJ-1/PfpI family protein [Ornithinibacillus scapharcae]|uniref:DJ-1/PfpI family protein n=1 Tax=Ornithinibacillus scapharcae TaxID=1147159 RepID=UPI000225AD4F|nr:DJ-1/PfpI family protein [Ornithinibacillus scapharcae]